MGGINWMDTLIFWGHVFLEDSRESKSIRCCTARCWWRMTGCLVWPMILSYSNPSCPGKEKTSVNFRVNCNNTKGPRGLEAISWVAVVSPSWAQKRVQGEALVDPDHTMTRWQCRKRTSFWTTSCDTYGRSTATRLQTNDPHLGSTIAFGMWRFKYPPPEGHVELLAIHASISWSNEHLAFISSNCISYDYVRTVIKSCTNTHIDIDHVKPKSSN